jgi:glycosyltransferase involved in cell wall biosynthesis
VVYGLSALAIPAAVLTSLALRRPSIGVLYGTFFYPALGDPLHMLRQFEELIAFKLPVDRLVILNDGTRGDEVARRLRVPTSRVRFWMHGVDVDECSEARTRASIRDHLGLPSDAKLVVSASRLAPWKRVDDVVRAVSQVVTAHPETILVISGSGPEEPMLRSLAARFLPADNVAFVGVLPRDVNLRLIAQADVFCSFYDFSNVGFALLEALAAGVPVVVTNTGATATIVTDGENGVIVEPRDTDAATEAISRLLDDAGERERLARNARERARKEFLRPDERARLEWALLRELGVPVSK